MSVKQGAVFIIGIASTFAGYADESVKSRQSANIVSYADVLQWVLALVIVLMVFAIVVWLLRKTGAVGFAGKNQLAVISGLSLGMREKLVLVKVGEKQLLLGVTPGRVDKLLELEGDSRLYQQQDVSADLESEPFARKLQRVMQGKTDA